MAKSKVKILKERLLNQLHESTLDISSPSIDDSNQFMKSLEKEEPKDGSKVSSLVLELPQSLKMSPNFPCLALRSRQPSINKFLRLFREGMNGLSGSALVYGEETEALYLIQAAIKKSLVERKARFPSAADITPQVAVIPCNTMKSHGETLIHIVGACLSGPKTTGSSPMENLEAALRVARKDGMPAVIVLSNFENLVLTKRQSLLFTLLDLAHREDLLFLVIGITTRSDIHVHLEKRVYSRLNARYIFLPDLSADDISKELCYYLSAPIYPRDNPELREFIQEFNRSIAKMFGYYLVKKYSEKFKSKNKRTFSDSEFSHLTDSNEEDFELYPFHTSTLHDGEDRQYMRDSRCILAVHPIRVKDAKASEYLQPGECGGAGEMRKYLKLIASKGIDPQEVDMWVLRFIFNIGSSLEDGEDEDDEEEEEKTNEDEEEETKSFFSVNNETYKPVDMKKVCLTSSQFINIVESQVNPDLIQVLVGLSYYEICLYACCARRQCGHNIDQLHYISQLKQRPQNLDDSANTLNDNPSAPEENSTELNTLKHILKLGGDECEMTVNEVINDFDKLTEAVSKGILSSKKIIELFLSLREKGLINFWTSTLRTNDPLFYNHNINIEGSTILTVTHHKEEINAAFRHKGNQQLVIIDRVRSAVTEPLVPLTYKA